MLSANFLNPDPPAVAIPHLRAFPPMLAAPAGSCALRAPPAGSVLDALDEVVFQVDREGKWSFLNLAWEALIGHPVAATLGRHCLDHVHPDDRAQIREGLAQLLSGMAEHCSHAIRYLHALGGVRWVETHIRSRLRADGTVDGVSGILRDISERRALPDRHRLAASIFANAGEGIIVTGIDGDILDVNAAFERITGYTRAEVAGRNPRLLNSGRHDREFYARMWQALRNAGSWRGEVWNRRKSGECYVEHLSITAIRGPDGQTSHYLGLFSDITRQKLQAAHLEHIAHYDSLTGLPNRRLLADRLQQSIARARSSHASVAVAYLDLDGFKAVNDSHGHQCGDELLVAVARRILGTVRASDTACRLGGDEFVVVFDCVQSIRECQPMLVRLLDAIAEPVEIGGKTVRVTGSVGISLYREKDEADADQLMRQADQAMYQAKMAGRNRFCVFDSLDYRSTLDRIEELGALERALGRREFVLHYQPIVHLRSGALHSVEALVRWNHPDRGILAPAAFLPALEGHPLMLALENWILEEAICQHERWLDAGLDVAVSVNMSGVQLHRKDFASHLRTLLAAHPRVETGRIKLEVLETSALDDLGHVSALIAACADFGVSFALDDFGTGYSSLRYLKQLPAKRIKIDQGFVRGMLEDPDDLAILEGVIGMAAAFRREVIAEGVESVEHARMLVQMGCQLAQGYGIARPMPPADLPAWLAGWRLPSELVACPILERDDILLLKALVETRSWRAALLAHVRDRSRPRPALEVAGLTAFDRWRALGSRRQVRCGAQVRAVGAGRDRLGTWVRHLADPSSEVWNDAEALRECDSAAAAFADALAALVGK